MNPPNSAATSYLGHVENGVVVFDTSAPFLEGQIVRVEPVDADMADPDRDERIRQLQALFATWDEEDAKLSECDSALLSEGLATNPGLKFKVPDLD